MLEHRGFMLDCARKFFPVRSIFRLLEFMSEGGMNVFHWHLTDAESFPVDWRFDGGKLAEEGAFRENGKVLCYNRDDVSEVCQKASSLGIKVIPEFDFPARCAVWGRAYPEMIAGLSRHGLAAELDLSRGRTWQMVAHFLVDMMDWFPESSVVHLGGDEVAGVWKDKDHRATQLRFHDTFERHLLSAYRRRPMLWADPVTQKGLALSRKFILQSWRTGENVMDLLDQGYPCVVSTSATWYVGNATTRGLADALLPEHPKLRGAELVWFTSVGDDPEDVDWLRPIIDAAGKRMKKA